MEISFWKERAKYVARKAPRLVSNFPAFCNIESLITVNTKAHRQVIPTWTLTHKIKP